MYADNQKNLYSIESESLTSYIGNGKATKVVYQQLLEETTDNHLCGERSNPLSLLKTINRGRVALFIDGGNLFYSALQLGIEVDYTKLLGCLTAGAKLLRAFFYTGVDSSNDKQQNFLLWMRRNGYRVITKELIEFADGSKKADLDVTIAVDMMTLVGCYDTAVLVSGDGDLAYAVNAVSYRGVRVEVVSLRSMTSDSLIDVADTYLDLNEIKTNIQKNSSCGSL